MGLDCSLSGLQDDCSRQSHWRSTRSPSSVLQSLWSSEWLRVLRPNSSLLSCTTSVQIEMRQGHDWWGKGMNNYLNLMAKCIAGSFADLQNDLFNKKFLARENFLQFASINLRRRNLDIWLLLIWLELELGAVVFGADSFLCFSLNKTSGSHQTWFWPKTREKFCQTWVISPSYRSKFFCELVWYSQKVIWSDLKLSFRLLVKN